MTIKIGKYEFNSEQQALDKIEALGTEIEGVYTPDMVDSIVKLGFLVITPATYDADGNEITPPVYSDNILSAIVFIIFAVFNTSSFAS